MQKETNEYQKLIKKAERLAYLALFTLVLSLGLLYFKVYDPTFSVFKNTTKEFVVKIDIILFGII